MRLLVKEDHRLPFVEFRAVLQGGVLAESASNNGITQLMSKMLLKGTQRRSAEEIAREIESVGGSIDSYGGNNSFGVNAEVMTDDFATGLDLLADVLLNPSFPKEALEREREVQAANIQSQKDNLLKSASKAMRRALFGNTGYGLDPVGSEDSIEKISSADLKAFHTRFATPDNCVMAIFGDVKTEEVKADVERAFAKWKSEPLTPSNGERVTEDRERGSQRIVETRDKKQAVVVIGFPGTTLLASDRYALELLQEACSDLGSRLFLRIREQLGLAYYVGAQDFPGLVPGYFDFYAGTMPEKIDLVEKELLREAELLRSEGLTEAELNRAKAKVIGQKKIARQDLGTQAMTASLDELYGLGFAHSDAEDQFYEAVTLEQVKAAAQRYLRTESMVVSVVQPSVAA